MISSLITFLVAVLVCYVIWYVCGFFVSGPPHRAIGLILAVLLLVYALTNFGLFGLGH